MRKASDILLIIAIAFGAFSSVMMIFLTGASFYITSPAYTDLIIEGLKNGTITTTFVGTVEEQAHEIQRQFVTIAVVVLLFTLLLIARIVLGVFAKKRKSNKFYIATLVPSALSLDVLFILGSIFGLVANKQEKDEDVEEIRMNY